MGHQVNFYLNELDTEKMESVLRGIAPMIVLHSRSSGPRPQELMSVNHVQDGMPWLYYFLVRPEDVDNVVMIHVPQQGYWSVDVTTSPVVQFNRCFFDGKVLKRGRVYYVDKFYGANSEIVVKSEAFRAWAKSILAAAKKGLRKQGIGYIGKSAEEWLVSSDGKLGE